MLLPVHDANPLRVIPFQIVTVAIIAICSVVYLFEMSLSEEGLQSLAVAYGTIPALLFDEAVCSPPTCPVDPGVAVLTSLFLHADFWHLAGNMLFLWVFGDNIEDAMGHIRFAIFYLLCGVAAAWVHALSDPASIAPTIGASGAIAGVMGAYLMLHPRVKVIVLLLNRFPLRLPAWLVLLAWLALQAFMLVTDDAGNVAIWAHIGGFGAGALLIPLFKRRSVPLFDRGVAH